MASRVDPETPVEPKWTLFLGRTTVAARQAKAFWAEIVPLLESAGVLSRLDRAVLIEACTCWGRALASDARCALPTWSRWRRCRRSWTQPSHA